MTGSTLEAWLRERRPAVPGPFLPFLLSADDAEPGPENLMSRGQEALSRSLQRGGRNREAAFLLLAADAFFTYACEAAAEGDDPGRSLEGLVLRLARTVV